MTTEIQKRLSEAGDTSANRIVDMHSIKKRSIKRRNRQRYLFGLSGVFIVMAGFVGFINLTQENMQSAETSQVTVSASSSFINESAERSQTTESTKEVVKTSETDSTFEMLEAQIDEPFSADSQPDEVSDTVGGKLLIRDGLIHINAAGDSTTLIEDTNEIGRQYFFTDIAPMEGTPHLFINKFEGVQLSDAKNILVSILAIDLVTGEVKLIEQREIKNFNSAEYYYNSHVTTDGNDIKVLRELWQGVCYYTETLAADGSTLQVKEKIPKPDWLASISTETIAELRGIEGPTPPQPCTTLDDIQALGGITEILGQHTPEINQLDTTSLQ